MFYLKGAESNQDAAAGEKGRQAVGRRQGEPVELAGKRLIFTHYHYIRPAGFGWYDDKGNNITVAGTAGLWDANIRVTDAPVGIRIAAYPAERRASGYAGAWGIDTVHTNDLHPAMFPVEVPEHRAKLRSDPGAVLLGAFCGAGATLIAAERVGRHCGAVEVQPAYRDVAVARWQRMADKKGIRGTDGAGVHAVHGYSYCARTRGRGTLSAPAWPLR
jgi:hypothetical protein